MIREEAEEDKSFSLSGRYLRGRILFLAFFFRPAVDVATISVEQEVHPFAQDGWLKLPPSQKRDVPLALTRAGLYSGCLQSPVLTQRTVMNSDKYKFPCPFLSSLCSLIMTVYLEKKIYSGTGGKLATPMFAHVP